DNNSADVMSESFGGCEASSTSAQAAAIASLAEQAAAQGITYVVSSGDSGSAGCDDPNTETQATHPAFVNIVASSPYTVAVGGTTFNENGNDSAYWKTTSAGNLGSTISIHPRRRLERKLCRSPMRKRQSQHLGWRWRIEYLLPKTIM